GGSCSHRLSARPAQPLPVRPASTANRPGSPKTVAITGGHRARRQRPQSRSTGRSSSSLALHEVHAVGAVGLVLVVRPTPKPEVRHGGHAAAGVFERMVVLEVPP